MGAGVFVVSLSYFLLSYWTTFGADLRRPAAHGLRRLECRAFFSVRRCITACSHENRSGACVTRAFPQLERSVYVWIASLLFIGVCWLWQPVAGTLWEVHGAARLALACCRSEELRSPSTAPRSSTSGNFRASPRVPHAQLQAVGIQDARAVWVGTASDLSGLVPHRLRGRDDDDDAIGLRGGELRVRPAGDTVRGAVHQGTPRAAPTTAM